MNILEIDTPAVLVDLDIAEANIERFQRHCDTHGLKLRPHIKTHKLPQLAKMQIQAGAVGITCQKISEAEALISDGGIDDVLITFNVVGAAKLSRLRKLADRVRLTVVADSFTVVDGLANAFDDASEALTVLVECDTGAGRCGVTDPGEAALLAQYIAGKPELSFGGLMTYPPVGQEAAVQLWLDSAKTSSEAMGLEVPVISTGGSP